MCQATHALQFSTCLKNISLWLQHNKLALTIDKIIIVSTYKNRSASNVCVQINESIFTPNTSYVYLGVIVDNKLNFVEQVIKLTSKLGRQ